MAEVKHLYTKDIDDFSLKARAGEVKVSGAWELFKQIRRWGLARDQILILVRMFGVGMSFRDIKNDMGYTSMGSLHRRYKEALEILKRNGWTK